MANKLKIYACSGIGDAAEQAPTKYWTDDTNTLQNTQAVNSLLAQINLRWSEVTRLQISQQDKADTLCDMDVLLVSLDAAKRYAKDADKLKKAGLDMEQARNSAIKLAIITAPYVYLIPSKLFY